MDHLWKGRTPENTELIALRWADIRNVQRWDDGDESEVRPARKLQTAGWLLYEGIDPADPTEEIIVLAATWDGEEGTWHDITCFPKMAYRGKA